MDALKEYINALEENAKKQIPEKDGSNEAENAFYYCDGFIDALRYVKEFIERKPHGAQVEQ